MRDSFMQRMERERSATEKHSLRGKSHQSSLVPKGGWGRMGTRSQGFLHRECNLLSSVPDEPDLGQEVVQELYFPVLRRKTRSLTPSHLEFFGTLFSW